MTEPTTQALIERLIQTNQFHENADVSTAEVVAELEAQAREIERLQVEAEQLRKGHFDASETASVLRAELAAIRAVPVVDVGAGLVEALRDAATSLETIGRLAGKSHYVGDGGERVETFMGHHDQVRGYAQSRASVARAHLEQPTEPAPSTAGEQAKVVEDLLMYAGDNGYSHIDYADTMRHAAALLQSTALPDHSEQHLDMVAALPVGELTDSEIDAVSLNQWGPHRGAPLAAHRAFARAILAAAHGITQGGKV